MVRPDIYIVGLNITKAEAHAMQKNGKGPRLVRIAHGVYVVLRSRDTDPIEEQRAEVSSLFLLYGIRIANHLLPDAGLTYSTAHYRAPVDGLIFVGGAYSYRKVIAENYGDFGIIQTGVSKTRDKDSVRQVLTDPDLFRPTPMRDPLGTYTVPVQTPEMILLTQFEAIKKNQDKLLKRAEIEDLMDSLVLYHGGPVPFLDRMKNIAFKADKLSEYERLLKTVLSSKTPTF